MSHKNATKKQQFTVFISGKAFEIFIFCYVGHEKKDRVYLNKVQIKKDRSKIQTKRTFLEPFWSIFWRQFE